jgi:hypothetical protein
MPDPVTAVTSAASVGGSLIGSSSAKKAAKVQAAAAEADRKLQQELYYDQVNRQEPFRQAGLTTQAELLRQFGLGGDATSAGYGNMLRDFSAEDFQADPGYAFRLSEGLKGMDRQAAARGGLISGGALKAAQRYGQEMGSQEYQNAYNRYNQNRGTRYSMLTGQQAVGQGATNQQGQASQNYGSAAGNAMQNSAAARASGYMGSANALAGGLGQIANNYSQQQMLNKILKSGGYNTGGYGGSNPLPSSPGGTSMFDRVMGPQ